jgi:hypothetical protein
MRFAEAIDRGTIHHEGSPDLVRAFPTWLGLPRFAKYQRRMPSRAPTIKAALDAERASGRQNGPGTA